MFSETPPTVINKRMSFLSVLVLSITSIVITVVLSAAGLGVYGLRLVDKKADGLVGLIGQVVEKLPELRDALPPAILDAMDDERRPEYLANLRVSVKLVEDEDHQYRNRAAVEIENKGDETVSLLTMRVVAMDKNGNPLSERKTWAVSPIQMDGDWRGPLLPHETRRFAVRHLDSDGIASVTHEVTDIRIWCGYDAAQDTDSNKLVAQKSRVARLSSSN